MSEGEIDAVIPNKIGAYRMRAVVGDGAFSVVKLVYNEETQTYYACKIVPRSRINTKALQDRFELEIRINQQLHHPGIVKLFDLLSDENNFYVIMEFCQSGELFQYIVDRGPLSEQDARPFVRQILECLEYIHRQNVTHRDLKPENLLLDQLGRVKLSDFGLSRFLGKDGLVETPCGSPCYASPECISGAPYDGKTTDVWSVGVILYAMLTGQLPWTKRNQAQLFAHQEEQIDLIGDQVKMQKQIGLQIIDTIRDEGQQLLEFEHDITTANDAMTAVTKQIVTLIENEGKTPTYLVAILSVILVLMLFWVA